MLDCGWEPGTIGEFERLSRLAQANRGFLQEIADTSAAGLLGRVVAAGTLQLRDLVAGAARFDTGTLRSAHRGELEPFGEGVQGTVFIDPDARNPVNRGQPAIYGEVLAARFGNWFENVMNMHADSILDGMEQTIMNRMDDLWL